MELTLSMPVNQGWTVATADVRPRSPLVLLTLRKGAESAHVRLDLDKRITLDDARASLTLASIAALVRRLVPFLLTSQSAIPIGRTLPESDPLGVLDLERVTEIMTGIAEWFAEGHDGYYAMWSLDEATPEIVWREVVERSREAGWSAEMKGTMVEIHP